MRRRGSLLINFGCLPRHRMASNVRQNMTRTFTWKRVITICLVVGVIASALYYRQITTLNPPYTIEIREVTPNGAVSFQPQNYADWNHDSNIAGLRIHTSDIIYHSVYSEGLQYCFSHSGHVYAMAGSENNEPSVFDRKWSWSGDPHKFPFYDYSKESTLVGP